jgi:hypothetical protein
MKILFFLPLILCSLFPYYIPRQNITTKEIRAYGGYRRITRIPLKGFQA